MDSLAGRHIVIVGGSRGIGASTARACSRAGAKVSIVYRSNASAAAQVTDALANGGAAYPADATDQEALQHAMDQAAQDHGPIHGLVISAGIFEGEPIQEMSLEFWRRTMSSNLDSTFLSVKTALPHMQEGSIVIVSSTAGQRGSAVYSAYATSKGAQLLFMRSMAKELAPHIRVNAVAPGWTETDMADASLTALGREEVTQEFPLGHIGTPEEVADAILFLLSDLSRFVTGTTVTVDGGSDMRG